MRCAFAISILLASCTSVSHERRVFDVPSTLPERVSAVEQNRPFEKSEATTPSLIDSTATSATTPKSSQEFRSNLIAAGLKALEEGNIAQALERSYELWHSLDVERGRSPEMDLKNPTFREPALLLALVQAESSQGNDTALVERIVRLNPTWEPGYLVLSNIYLNRGAYKLTEKVVITGLDRVEKPSPSLYALHTKTLFAQKRADAATKVVDRALTLYANDPRLLQWKATLEYSLGHLEKSCGLFASAMELSSNDPSLLHNHALCLAHTGQLEEAIGVLKPAMNANSNNAPLRLLAGHVLKRLGKHSEARIVWRDYLDLASANAPQRSEVMAALKNLDTASNIQTESPQPLAPR